MVGVDVGADVIVGVAVVDDVVGDDDVGDGVAGRDGGSVVGMVVGASAASVCWKRYAVSSTASSVSSTACVASAGASWRAAIATFQRISRLNDRPTPL